MAYFAIVAQVVGAIVGFVLAFAGSIYAVRKSQIRDQHEKLGDKIEDHSEDLGKLQSEFSDSSAVREDFISEFIQSVSDKDLEGDIGEFIQQLDTESKYERMFVYLFSIQAKLVQATETTDYALAHNNVQAANKEALEVLILGKKDNKDFDLPPDISQSLFTTALTKVMAISASDIFTADMVIKSPSKSVLRESLLLLFVGTVVPLFMTMSIPSAVLSNMSASRLFIFELIHFLSTLAIGKFTLESLIRNLDNTL